MLTFFLSVLLSACIFSSDKGSFQSKYKEGNENFAKGNLTEAADSFMAALRLAEIDNWNMGKVMAKRQLAVIQIARGNYVLAVDGLDEAVGLCESDPACSTRDLDVLYGYIGTTFLYKTNELDKARGLIDRIRASKKTDENGNSSLCSYLGLLDRSKKIAESSELMASSGCR